MNRNIGVMTIAVLAAAMYCGLARAQAPAGSTGECKDGSYTTAEKKSGACSGHGGVKSWYGDSKAAAPAKTTTAPVAAPAKTMAAAPSDATGECKDGTYTTAEKKSGACSGHGGVKSWYGQKTAAPATTASKPAAATTPAAPSQARKSETASTMPSAPAPGGGQGKVWVNTSSNVYHCMGDEWYGKTKQGQYMTEAQAKAAGNRAAGGKACS